MYEVLSYNKCFAKFVRVLHDVHICYKEDYDKTNAPLSQAVHMQKFIKLIFKTKKCQINVGSNSLPSGSAVLMPVKEAMRSRGDTTSLKN